MLEPKRLAFMVSTTIRFGKVKCLGQKHTPVLLVAERKKNTIMGKEDGEKESVFVR